MNALISVPLLSILGTFICWSIAKFLNSPWSTETTLICIATILTVYFANESTDTVEDLINKKTSPNSKKKYLIISIIMCIVCSLYSFFKQINIMYLSILLIGFFYSFKLIPFKSKYIRLKDIPVIKNLIVSFYWSIPTVMIPLWVAKTEVNISSDTIIITIILGLSTFISTIISDAIDETGDRLANVKTLPVLFGVKNTLNILTIILFVIGITAFITFYLKHNLIFMGLIFVLWNFLNLNMFIAKSNFKFKNVLVDLDLLIIGSYLLLMK